MDWHIGQRIVCINDTFEHPQWKRVPNKPKLGQIYTIRDIFMEVYEDGDELAFHLNEVRNDRDLWLHKSEFVMHEYGFAQARFKPLQETKRKTSIAVFKKMLVPDLADA